MDQQQQQQQQQRVVNPVQAWVEAAESAPPLSPTASALGGPGGYAASAAGSHVAASVAALSPTATSPGAQSQFGAASQQQATLAQAQAKAAQQQRYREKLEALMKEWNFKDLATAEAYYRRTQRAQQGQARDKRDEKFKDPDARLRRLRNQVDQRVLLRPEDVQRPTFHGPEMALHKGSLRGPPSRQLSETDRPSAGDGGGSGGSQVSAGFAAAASSAAGVGGLPPRMAATLGHHRAQGGAAAVAAAAAGGVHRAGAGAGSLALSGSGPSPRKAASADAALPSIASPLLPGSAAPSVAGSDWSGVVEQVQAPLQGYGPGLTSRSHSYGEPAGHPHHGTGGGGGGGGGGSSWPGQAAGRMQGALLPGPHQGLLPPLSGSPHAARRGSSGTREPYGGGADNGADTHSVVSAASDGALLRAGGGLPVYPGSVSGSSRSPVKHQRAGVQPQAGSPSSTGGRTTLPTMPHNPSVNRWVLAPGEGSPGVSPSKLKAALEVGSAKLASQRSSQLMPPPDAGRGVRKPAW
jgi:hypothetical protein